MQDYRLGLRGEQAVAEALNEAADCGFRPTTYTNVACQVYTFQWNSRGQLTGVTNPKGESVSLNYDTNGYLRNIQQPWSGGTKTTSLGYDGFGRVNNVTNSDNYVLNYAYDDFDRLTKVTYPDQTFEQYLYDRLDLVRARDRSGKWTQITYDAVSRPLSVVDRLGQTNLFSWCGCGGLDSITDPLGHATSWVRDLEGRVTEKHYYDGTVTHFGYGTNCDWLLSVTNADNSVKHYGYAIDESLTNVTYTGAAVATPPVTFGYDPNYPRLTSMTDGTGTTTFGYYPITTNGGTLGALRLHTVDGPLANDTITYQYDALNRMTNRAINSVNESVAFDELGRITNHTSVLGAFVPAYVNATRRLNSLAYPNGQTTVFDYFDNAGDRRLKEIWNKTGSTATLSKFDYDYDVLGRIKQWTQQTDASTPNVMIMDYDNEDQLLGATITPQGQSVSKAFAYVYDAAGNRTGEQRETAGAGGGFSASGSAYNNVNQLTGRALGPVTFQGTVNQPAEVGAKSGSTSVVAKMTQDPNSTSNGKIFTAALNLPAGNNTVTVVATNFALPTSFETTKNYQLTVVDMPAKTFAYDANGNLTNEVTAATTNGYSWDAEDRLVQITLFTNNTHFTSQFTYDGFGRRVQIVEKNNGTTTSTKNFVWSGRQLCEERDAGDNVTKRFLAEGEQINGTSYYFTFDHLGSLREMTDSSGTIHARYDYDPYGRRTKISGDLDADFGFTGYYVHQPSGLQLALYRAYDADLGRFINRDPIGEAGGLNLYDYVANNPINFYDPLGLYGYATKYWADLSVRGRWWQKPVAWTMGVLSAVVPDTVGISVNGSAGFIAGGTVGVQRVSYIQQGVGQDYTFVGKTMGPDDKCSPGFFTPQISIGFSFSIAWSGQYNPGIETWTGKFSEVNVSEGPISEGGFWSDTYQGFSIGGSVGPVPVSASYIDDVDYQEF